MQVIDSLVLNSVEEVLNEVKKYRSEDVYVVGGASIYEQFLPYCDVAHITKIDFEYFADRHMPNLDRDG